MMSKTKISKVEHKGEYPVKVDFPITPTARAKIKVIFNRKICQTHHCWFIPYTDQMQQLLEHYFNKTTEVYLPISKRKDFSLIE